MKRIHGYKPGMSWTYETRCGREVFDVDVTAFWDRVTCKRCLAIRTALLMRGD